MGLTGAFAKDTLLVESLSRESGHLHHHQNISTLNSNPEPGSLLVHALSPNLSEWEVRFRRSLYL